MSSDSSRGGAGGSAAAGGTRYESLVAAWYLSRTLAGDLGPLLDFDSETQPVTIRYQTEAPVDDLLVETSSGGFLFIQCKRTAGLGSSSLSTFASAFEQFIAQWNACRQKAYAANWCRPLSPDRDRLILTIGGHNAAPISRILPKLLKRYRATPDGGPLASVAVNVDEKKAASDVAAILVNAFQHVLGREPTADDEKDILQLFYIQVLDVEGNGHDAQDAKGTLRRFIVEGGDAALAEKAWGELALLSLELATDRSGVYASQLRSEVRRRGIRLAEALDYAADIAALRKWTDQKLQVLSAFNRLKAADATSRIEREVLAPLVDAAMAGSLLVTGEPGAGKSGVIYELGTRLREAGNNVLFLAVDRLGVSTRGQLQGELGLTKPLAEVLENWESDAPSYLIIDALDAARKFDAQVVFTELIRDVLVLGGSWHVVASVRKYDLRHGEQWASLFGGSPPSPKFSDPEFRHIKHISIPELSPAEIGEIAKHETRLVPLLSNASGDFLRLIQNIFNMHLLVQLLDQGSIEDDLKSIQTQSALLNLWWRRRIRGSDLQHDSRERTLKFVLDIMIRERALSILRAQTHSVSGFDFIALASLEQLGVLRAPEPADPDDDRIQFSHHILFDYAVARITFGRGRLPNSLISIFRDDRDLALVLRPSLTMAILDTWLQPAPRESFWRLGFDVAGAAEIPEVVKLAAPMVAAEQASSVDDLAPLVSELSQIEDLKRHPTLSFLEHLTGAYIVISDSKTPISGSDRVPWAELAYELSKVSNFVVMISVRTLIWKLSERSETLTDRELAFTGDAARRLLAFVWSLPNYESNLTINSIMALIATYRSNPAASRALVRQVMTPQHMRLYAHVEFQWLCRGIAKIIDADPDFAWEVYEAAYGHEETSDAKTSIGESQLLPLTSNRRQDFEMAWYMLCEALPAYLDRSPEMAVRAICQAVLAYRTRLKEVPGKLTKATINGDRIEIEGDLSFTWRQLEHRRDALALLAPFDAWLDRVARSPQSTATFRSVIAALSKYTKIAGLWATILAAAERNPKVFGGAVIDLLTNADVLQIPEIRYGAGRCIAKIFPIIETAARSAIEAAILKIENSRVQGQLLSEIQDEDFVTDTARLTKDNAKTSGTLESNRPIISYTMSHGIYGTEQYLRDQGVNTEEPTAQRVLYLETTLQTFSTGNLNGIPVSEQVDEVWPVVVEAWNFFQEAAASPPDLALEHLLALLSEVCARLVRADFVRASKPVMDVVTAIVFRGSESKSPEFIERAEEQFNTSISWGGPAARISAAEAVMVLVGQKQDDAFPSLALRLLRDSVSAVRWQVAHQLYLFLPDHTAIFEEAVGYLMDAEKNRGVISGFIGEVLPRIANADQTVAIEYCRKLLGRFIDDPSSGADTCVEHLIRLTFDIYIWENNKSAEQLLEKYVWNAANTKERLNSLLAVYRDNLTLGAYPPTDQRLEGVRVRSIAFYDRATKWAFGRADQIMTSYGEEKFDLWNERDKEEIRNRFDLLHTIGQGFYFASGAYDRENFGRGPKRTPTAVQRRFFNELAPTIDLLCRVPLAPLAHHLLQVLEFFIPVDPKRIFASISKTVKVAETGGYTLESMGAGVFVRIVERYLADHRDVFDDTGLRNALLDALDAFVRAGWPDARRLTFRIAEIWR